MGRPLRFQTVEDLRNAADKYFEVTPEEEWTITGLALSLNSSRETLMSYQEREDFADAIKEYKERIHMAYEKDLRKKGRAGDIFALKNFGWTDRMDVNTNLTGSISFEGMLDTLTNGVKTIIDGEESDLMNTFDDGEIVENT